MENPRVKKLRSSAFLKYNVLAVCILVTFLLSTYAKATTELKWSYDSLNAVIENNYKNLWVYRIVFFSYGCLLYYGSFTSVVSNGAKKIAVLPELCIILYGVAYVMLGFFSFEIITENVTFIGKSFETFYLLSNIAHLLLLLSILWHSILDIGLRIVHFFFLLTATTLFAYTIYNHPNTGATELFLYMVQLIWLAVFYNRNKKIETVRIES
jgi:hypothetical protein